MTARCEKTSLVIAQLYQSAEASFFTVVFIEKIGSRLWDAQCKEKVRGTFLMERRAIPRSDNAVGYRIATLLSVRSDASLGRSEFKVLSALNKQFHRQ